ncbi:hypothetical protein AB205_0038230, partial [Aquarana catesbeiana]
RSIFKTWLILCVLHQLPINTKSLSAGEKAAVLSRVGKIESQGGALGSEALTRYGFPQTKIYFTHFDLTPGSADLNTHGGKIINALAGAANHLDGIAANLSSLSDLHAYNLRVDPGNFPVSTTEYFYTIIRCLDSGEQNALGLNVYAALYSIETWVLSHLLSHIIQVVLANRFPDDFTAEVQAA